MDQPTFVINMQIRMLQKHFYLLQIRPPVQIKICAYILTVAGRKPDLYNLKMGIFLQILINNSTEIPDKKLEMYKIKIEIFQ